MAAGAVLVRGGGTLYWVDAAARRVLARELLWEEPEALARLAAGGFRSVPPAGRRAWAERVPGGGLSAEPAIARSIREAGGRVRDADLGELREARSGLPTVPTEELRRWLLPLARESARTALASPEETLIALAREEARLERALGRERGAQSQFVSPPDGALSAHAEEAARFAEAFARHHGALEARIEAAATAHLPNLSSLVGPKIAARLLAAAGGRRALARISGARLQLLGSRRRPDPERGPRFGLIYRAPGIEGLPDDRRGRFARSLAALAVIAARADEHTHRDLRALLNARRDRRWKAIREATR